MFKLYISIIMVIGEVAVVHACIPSFLCHKNNVPQKIPETKDELKELCQAGFEYFTCYTNYTRDGCVYKHGQVSETIQYLDEKMDENFRGVQEVCNESSSLYAAIADNLKCFSEFEKKSYLEKCYAQVDPKQIDLYIPEEYAEIRSKEGIIPPTEINFALDDLSWCFYYYQPLACYATKLEETCGTSALDIYLTVIHKISSLGPAEIMFGCEETEHMIPKIISLYKLQRTEGYN